MSNPMSHDWMNVWSPSTSYAAACCRATFVDSRGGGSSWECPSGPSCHNTSTPPEGRTSWHQSVATGSVGRSSLGQWDHEARHCIPGLAYFRRGQQSREWIEAQMVNACPRKILSGAVRETVVRMSADNSNIHPPDCVLATKPPTFSRPIGLITSGWKDNMICLDVIRER